MDPNQLVSTHFEKSLKDFRIENWELEYLDMFEDMLACYEARVKAHNKSSDTRNSPSSHTIPACGSSSSSPRSYPVEASKIEGLPLLISASPFTIKLSRHSTISSATSHLSKHSSYKTTHPSPLTNPFTSLTHPTSFP